MFVQFAYAIEFPAPPQDSDNPADIWLGLILAQRGLV
jgi:hypothetical protein